MKNKTIVSLILVALIAQFPAYAGKWKTLDDIKNYFNKPKKGANPLPIIEVTGVPPRNLSEKIEVIEADFMVMTDLKAMEKKIQQLTDNNKILQNLNDGATSSLALKNKEIEDLNHLLNSHLLNKVNIAEMSTSGTTKRSPPSTMIPLTTSGDIKNHQFNDWIPEHMSVSTLNGLSPQGPMMKSSVVKISELNEEYGQRIRILQQEVDYVTTTKNEEIRELQYAMQNQKEQIDNILGARKADEVIHTNTIAMLKQGILEKEAENVKLRKEYEDILQLAEELVVEDQAEKQKAIDHLTATREDARIEKENLEKMLNLSVDEGNKKTQTINALNAMLIDRNDEIYRLSAINGELMIKINGLIDDVENDQKTNQNLVMAHNQWIIEKGKMDEAFDDLQKENIRLVLLHESTVKKNDVNLKLSQTTLEEMEKEVQNTKEEIKLLKVMAKIEE